MVRKGVRKGGDGEEGSVGGKECRRKGVSEERREVRETIVSSHSKMNSHDYDLIHGRYVR